MVAASAMADRKTFGHRTYRVATRRQTFKRPNMISIRLRRLQRCLSYLIGLSCDFRPGMQGFIPYLQRLHGTNPHHTPDLPKISLRLAGCSAEPRCIC